MRIVKITLYHLSATLTQPIYWSTGHTKVRGSLLVQIQMDNGIIGWGETIRCEAFQALKQLAEYLPGQCIEDINDIQIVHKRLKNTAMQLEIQTKLYMCALGAIDIALWDMLGKKLGVPVSKLAGKEGCKKVMCYASGGYPTEKYDSSQFKNLIEDYVKMGFQAVKIKIGHYDMEVDMERIRIAREIIKPERLLFIDINQAYNAQEYEEIYEHIKTQHVSFVEEPFGITTTQHYEKIRNLKEVKIAAGENFYSTDELKQFVDKNILDIIQPDIGNTGGFTELLPLNPYFGEKNIKVCPHLWGTNLITNATLGFCSAIEKKCTYQGIPLIEYDCTENPLRGAVCKLDGKIIDGYINIYGGNGIGSDVSQENIEPFIFESCYME